jgi:hypothetical protein
MKNSPDVVPDSSGSPQGINSLVRFWLFFILCLAALGLVSGLMLVGLFLLMGYHIL